MKDSALSAPLSDSRVELLTTAARTFSASLGGAALAHLTERGLADTAVEHGLGSVPGDTTPEWKPYVGMISIPYLTMDGECVAIRFRNLTEGGPKYLQPAGSSLSVYNLQAVASTQRTIVITEGEFDCLVLAKLGYAAIGMPGASSWKPSYARLIDGFDKVIAWGDPDDAGRKFNENILDSVRRSTAAYMDVDINDAYKRDMFRSIGDAYQRAGGQK